MRTRRPGRAPRPFATSVCARSQPAGRRNGRKPVVLTGYQVATLVDLWSCRSTPDQVYSELSSSALLRFLNREFLVWPVQVDRREAMSLISKDARNPVPLLPGRRCGECSLCCKLLRIEAFNKPVGTWCAHCAPGRGGCTIYETRPTECREFFCAWLTIACSGSGVAPQQVQDVRAA